MCPPLWGRLAACLAGAEWGKSSGQARRPVLPRRREGRLAGYESVRIYRLARISALAKHYIGDDQAATRWLKRPNRALGGAIPLRSIDTEIGARAVEDILGRIAYGGVS